MAPLLVLYSRLPGYFLNCLRQFHLLTGVPVEVIRYRADQLAPFTYDDFPGINLSFRDEWGEKELISLFERLQPCGIVMSGWQDRGYMKVAKMARKKGLPVIAGMDNQWEGNLRQRLATILSPWLLHRSISHLWVPGRFQYEFGRRLGFARTRILMGWYAADVGKFQSTKVTSSSLKRFLYVGRLIPHKGINDLLAVASQFAAEGLAWQFHLIGSGPLANELPDLPNLKHTAFLQPEDLAAEAAKGGVFVLPSHFEPWGVVLHEFAAAGYPLVAAEAVGARDAFLRDGFNGLVFRTKDSSDLGRCLNQLMELSEEARVQMGNRSQVLAKAHTSEVWANLLQQTLQSWK